MAFLFCTSTFATLAMLTLFVFSVFLPAKGMAPATRVSDEEQRAQWEEVTAAFLKADHWRNRVCYQFPRAHVLLGDYSLRRKGVN
jgi:hypothetical protein